jgi:hypothetical protein
MGVAVEAVVLVGTGFCLGLGVGTGIWAAMRVLESWS